MKNEISVGDRASPKLSVYIIAYNERDKIRAAISSVKWADEILVVDSWSTDGTTEIALEMGARVIHAAFNGYGDIRNKAIAECKYSWIFSLDCDERCTKDSRDEILRIINSDPSCDAYWTPRKNFFMGRWVQHSGWFPNYRQPQLFRKGAMKYDTQPVHEKFIMFSDLPVGYMHNAIWQFPFKDFSQLLDKANRYSSLGALKVNSHNVTMWDALWHGLWAFTKHYVLKLGILDGWAGFVIALGNFEGTFYRYAKAVEIRHQKEWVSKLATLEQTEDIQGSMF